MAKDLFSAPRTNSYLFTPEELVIVGEDTPVETAREHPLYDERVQLPVNRQLVDAIKTHGFITSIKVRKEGEYPVVVDGRQRVRAARVANAELKSEGKEQVRVRADVQRGDDTVAMGVMILSNELRTEDSVMVKAAKASRYLATGKTESEVAVTFGVSVETVESWMVLLNLPGELQAMVESKAIGAVAAATLGKLPRNKQLSAAHTLTQNGTVRGTAKAASALVRAELPTARKVAKSKTVGTDCTVQTLGKIDTDKLLSVIDTAVEKLTGPQAEVLSLHNRARALYAAYSSGKVSLPMEVAECLDWVVNNTPPGSVGMLHTAVSKVFKPVTKQ